MRLLCNKSARAGGRLSGALLNGYLVVAVCLLSSFLPIRLRAQATEGSILGTVTDPSGAALVHVQITVTDVLTNAIRTTFTNGSGEYVVTNLPLGSYSVSAEAKGFKRAVQPPVELTVKARIRVDLHMSVGEVTESVQVTGAAPLLKTDTAEVSTLVSRQQLESLPSFDRHFLSMQVLVPGTYRNWQGNNDRVGDFSGGESMMVAGQGSGQNDFILDGVSNNVELTGGLNLVPATDAIQEVSIQTNGYSAEFGRAGGSVVNVALRSGTNELHGFAYDYLQNDIFDAKPYDFTGTNPVKTPLRKNLFGAGVGGPIIKNKIFLFGNYEGLRQPQNTYEYDTVPTALERNGDFSQSGWTVYDPATTDAAGNRTAFPGNVIPQSRINPIMQKLISIYPVPNYTDPNPSVLNNYLATDINNDSKNAMNLKGDVNLRSSDSMTIRYSKQWYSKIRSGYMPDSWIGGNAKLNGTNSGLTETHIFSPTLVNEARLGWNYIVDGNFSGNDTVIEELNGIPGAVIAPSYPAVSPRNISSTKAVRPLRTLPNPYELWQNSVQVMDNLSWQKGKHSLKVGFDFEHNREDVGGASPGGVKFSIDGYMTVASIGAKRPSNLTGTAEALLGMANALTTYYYYDKTRMRVNRTSFFAQDEWRLSPKLSISLGLRYEHFPNWSFPTNQVTNFDFNTGNILVPEEARSWIQSVLGLPGGTLPPGYQYLPIDQVVGRNIGHDFSPRVGFAYSLSNKLVLRGGYGIFYGFQQALDTNNTNGAPFNFEVQLNGDIATPVLVDNGFPSSGIYDTLNSNGIAMAEFQSEYRDPYVQKYGMNLQYMPFKKTLIDVGYEGDHSLRLPNSLRVNYPTPAPGDLVSRRPYPQWGEGFGIAYQGYAHYNSLVLKFQEQLTHGLSIYSVLTVQHNYGNIYSPDPYNWNYGYGTMDDDYGKQWVTSFIYDTPAMAGRNRLMRGVLGGWQCASIIQFRGGLPFSVASSQTMNDDLDSSRADVLVTNGPAALPSGQRSINEWFNVNAFATPPDYTWGNSGYNILRGPSFTEVEFSLQKSFSIAERYQLTFRAEAENLLNHVNLGQPAATLGSSGFGTIRSLNGDPRMMQMVLKFKF